MLKKGSQFIIEKNHDLRLILDGHVEKPSTGDKVLVLSKRDEFHFNGKIISGPASGRVGIFEGAINDELYDFENISKHIATRLKHSNMLSEDSNKGEVADLIKDILSELIK